jgi:beta-phosphoglucomutase-like phosphatase (HAD superfamily)
VHNGVRAAKAAGIYCVGYSIPSQDLSEADVIINHFAELDFESQAFIQSKLGNN